MEQAPAWTQPVSAPVSVAETVQNHEEELFSAYSTLNEPVMETVMRDVRAVAAKLRVVMQPLDRAPILPASYSRISSQDTSGGDHVDQQQQQQQQPAQGSNDLSENDQRILRQLKDWDLWGPLVLCLALGILLSLRSPANQVPLVFAAVFCSVWVGGSVVTLNVQLLGGTISFFQSLCVLGYSLFPMVIAASILVVIRFALLDAVIVFISFLWATRTSAFFVSLYISPERKVLALFPVFYFYTFMGWIILFF